MAPLNEQQLDQLHIQRIVQIKKAALKVFANRGIIGTKISMIAAEAGISQGLSYRYFKSKEELLITLIQDALEEAKAAMEQVNHLPGTPLEKLRSLTKSMLDDSNKYFFMLIQQASSSEEVPEKAKQLLEQFSKENPIQLLIPLFIEGQRMGQFCEGDPYKLLFCYFSVITGLMLQEVQADENYWVHEVDLLMKVIMK
ncbi:TetR/AcrR family transcriptional regulator [Lederbergia wuyishanensis]|uniref:AcrR family transcriptional regulator n=1 Tax=Lederbergia wuyishanensis TaxID=1347903 RepID=A0ABU0D820_9BACI|nr:TetR/AcrR family transcriptional regulator [Lederbergia wuyishanensis]MCJ8009324.1 TetR/AcrR family transcriptional regulator [Lederbergia wuyishanensis]MDQ0344542.1 AcrR family transcriptional regulator [Lederbergia wuyishanensis]